MNVEADTMIKHGEIQLIDYYGTDGHQCEGCGENSAYALSIGKTTIRLCYKCIGDLGHCVIDGLL